MKSIVKISIILLLGIAIGLMGAQFLTGKPQAVSKKIRYWVAPMDANYKRDKPGKSPMGMALVPVYENNAPQTNGSRGVVIEPRVQNNISIKLEKVLRQTLNSKIDTVGYVSVDENNIDKINSYVDGWVKNLQVSSNGQMVKKGDLLFELYSPTLLSAQQEYLLALKNRQRSFIKAGEEKLITLGMSKNQIQQLKQSKLSQKTFKIYANVNGIVSNLAIRDGIYIKPEKTVMSIINLSKIWVDTEVYDKDAAAVKIGQQALAKFNSYPNKEWLGELTFIYPELDPVTRTLKVRLEFPNPDLLLLPNMFADVQIFTKPSKQVLSIPSSAVIQNNNMNYVIKTGKKNNFYAQEVLLGQQQDNVIEVKDGLKEGELLVVSGQFLIDSESNVRQSLRRLSKKTTRPVVSSEIIGEGKILAIDMNKHRITIDHFPIRHINMPSMVMSFNVGKSVPLKALSPGQKINFVLEKNSEDSYVITRLKVLSRKDR